jgi:hypothetical protein
MKQVNKIISDLERDIDMDIVYFRDTLEEKKRLLPIYKKHLINLTDRKMYWKTFLYVHQNDLENKKEELESN